MLLSKVHACKGEHSEHGRQGASKQSMQVKMPQKDGPNHSSVSSDSDLDDDDRLVISDS